MKYRQELYCHNCDKYVQFDMDLSLNGNHEIVCPNCRHLHYRYIKDGIIADGYMPNNVAVWQSTGTTTFTATSTYDAYAPGRTGTGCATIGDTFLYQRWMDTT